MCTTRVNTMQLNQCFTLADTVTCLVSSLCVSWQKTATFGGVTVSREQLGWLELQQRAAQLSSERMREKPTKTSLPNHLQPSQPRGTPSQVSGPLDWAPK